MPDITTIRGDSRIVGIPVFDADLDEYRLTGVDQTTNPTLDDVDEISYQVSDKPGDNSTNVYLSKTDADAAVEIVPASDLDSVNFSDIPTDAAIIKIKLAPSDTQDLPVEDIWHECQLTDINGDVTTVMRGEFSVIESLTNP